MYSDYETISDFYGILKSSNVPVLTYNTEEVISPADVDEIKKKVTRENCLSFMLK